MNTELRMATVTFMIMMWSGIIISGMTAHCSAGELAAPLAGSTAVILLTTAIAVVYRRIFGTSECG